jgi:hypothetical protein
MVGRFPKCAIDYGERRISAEYDYPEKTVMMFQYPVGMEEYGDRVQQRANPAIDLGNRSQADGPVLKRRSWYRANTCTTRHQLSTIFVHRLG